MNKTKLNGVLRSARATMVRRSPEILTGIGVAGMITTTVLAVKATPKAMRLIEEEKAAKNAEMLTAVETVKTTWKCYIPTAVTGTLSIACIIGATSTNAKRNAALAAAYKLSETAFTEYKEKVVETIGEKKEQTVKDSIAKTKVEKDPVKTTEVIITDKGETLCYESISGRYFKSDRNKIENARLLMNNRLISQDYVSLTELYSELGLDGTSISDFLGWRLDNGLIELYYSSQLASDGTPCLVIQYENPPTYDYANFA